MLIDGKKQKHVLTKQQKVNEEIAVPGLSGWICVPSARFLPQSPKHVPDVQCHSYHCKEQPKISQEIIPHRLQKK